MTATGDWSWRTRSRPSPTWPSTISAASVDCSPGALESAATIRGYSGPLLQTHGDADGVVPYNLGRRLFAAANKPKWFITVPRGDHNDPPAPEYLKALDRFLGGAAGPTAWDIEISRGPRPGVIRLDDESPVSEAPVMPSPRLNLTIRWLMAVVLYLAIDLASYHAMMANGSGVAIVFFLVMNGLVPVMVGAGLIVRRIRRDHTPTTLY